MGYYGVDSVSWDHITHHSTWGAITESLNIAPLLLLSAFLFLLFLLLLCLDQLEVI